MRTTLDLPDELFRQVKAKAASEGATLKEMLKRFIESGLRQPSVIAGSLGRRSKPPVIQKRGSGMIPNLSSELQDKLESEEDIAKLYRSFGR
jgi:hypothetical protein